MTEIKDLAIAVSYLVGVNAFDEIEGRFSQEDKALFINWFESKWDDSWDAPMIEEALSKIAAKIKQLKGE